MRTRVVLASAALASCSLFSGLSGLTGGGDDTAPAPPDVDAASAVDGSKDATSDESTQVEIDAATTPASRYRDAVMSDTPLAYFRFEETGGVAAKDETGAHDGMWLTTPTFSQQGAFDGSTSVLFQQGTPSRLSIPGDVFRFAGTVPYAVEIWLKPGRFVDYEWILTTEAPRGGWSILADATGAVHYEVWDMVDGSNASVRYLVPTAKKLVLGAFSHVVVTYDGTNAGIWIDGTNARTDPWPKPAPSIGSLFLSCLDKGGGTLQHCLDGWFVDDLAIYAHALDDARIQEHYAIASAH